MRKHNCRKRKSSFEDFVEHVQLDKLRLVWSVGILQLYLICDCTGGVTVIMRFITTETVFTL